MVSDLVCRGVGIRRRFDGLFDFLHVWSDYTFNRADIYIYIFVNAISLVLYLHGFISVPWIVPATLYCPPASTTRCCSLYRSEVLMIQLFWLERHWLSLTGENSTIGVHKQSSVVPKLEQN